MSVGPDPQVDSNVIEQERRRLSRRLDEVARLCETNVPGATFYGEMLKRLLESLAAPAGAVWTRTPQGNLQLQFQVNLKEVGVDRTEEARASHEELLRQAVMQPRQLHLLPHSGVGPAEEGKAAAGNPTDHLLLLVPILTNGQVSGLIEVWQSPNRPLNAVPGFLQFMSLMADLAGRYQRNQMLGQMVGQQQLWSQLEAFARQVHGSLNPTEVAYLVANEGRRLIECDRVSVAVRRAQKAAIEAVSGADVVEKRSNLVQLMRKLCDRVIEWGERLVFKGTKDDSLPPKVLDALDAYLAESPSKLLVVEPLHDEREDKNKDKGKHKKPARAALVMECFEPPADAQQYVNRLEVVSRHAAPALYNAVEHRRIPMRFLWMPLAKLQEGLGGKARAISALVVVALSLIGSAMVLVPYPLKMDATGNLVPAVRVMGYPPETGRIEYFQVNPNDVVVPGRDLAVLYDPKVESKIKQLITERDTAQHEAQVARTRMLDQQLQLKDRLELETTAGTKEQLRLGKEAELRSLMNSIGAYPKNPTVHDRITFTMRAPEFSQDEARLVNKREWTVLNSNFKEEWKGKEARPSEPILRLGAKDGPHELELRIPQKHIGQVLAAMAALERAGKPQVLDVDFLLRTTPEVTYKGKLYRDKIAGQADPNRDDKDEPEPVVLAYVSIDDDSIPAADRLPAEQLLSGAEVHAKVRCGNHRLGYSLFYGVWEFFYEKVVFFF